MLIYAVFYSIPAVLALIYDRYISWSPVDHALLVCFSLFVLGFIGLRYETGADWDQYEYIFRLADTSRLVVALQVSDPAFMFLCWATAALGGDVTVVMLVCAAIGVTGLVQFSMQTRYPWLVYCVAMPHFLIVMNMAHVRQSAAIGCLLLGVVGLMRGSVRRYILWGVAATAFHRTAIIFLPLIAVVNHQNRFVVSASAAAVSIGAYLLFLEGAVELYTRRYVESAYGASGGAYRVAMNVLPALIFLAFGKQFEANLVMRRFWYLVAWLGIILAAGFLFFPSSAAIDRLAKYCLPLQFYVFGLLPDVIGTKVATRLAIRSATISFYALYLYVWLAYSNQAREHWLPYNSIFTR